MVEVAAVSSILRSCRFEFCSSRIWLGTVVKSQLLLLFLEIADMLIQVVKLLSFGNQLVVQLLAPSIPLFSNEHIVLFQLLIIATRKLFTSSLEVLELLALLSKFGFQLSTVLL